MSAWGGVHSQQKLVGIDSETGIEVVDMFESAL